MLHRGRNYVVKFTWLTYSKIVCINKTKCFSFSIIQTKSIFVFAKDDLHLIDYHTIGLPDKIDY
jgi:hypothetical protein